MTYLLDTNACIRYLNGRSVNLCLRLESHSASQIAVCSIVKGELFVGAMKSHFPSKTLAKQQQFLDQFVSLPFDDLAADAYSRLRADIESIGQPIGPLDMLIAAIAVANNLTLITNNTREFSRVVGLQQEDWEI